MAELKSLNLSNYKEQMEKGNEGKQYYMECPTCKGTGTDTYGFQCPDCKGLGYDKNVRAK